MDSESSETSCETVFGKEAAQELITASFSDEEGAPNWSLEEGKARSARCFRSAGSVPVVHQN